jgi:hypothetical protein
MTQFVDASDEREERVTAWRGADAPAENGHTLLPEMTAAMSGWSCAFPHRGGKCQLCAMPIKVQRQAAMGDNRS